MGKPVRGPIRTGVAQAFDWHLQLSNDAVA